MHLHALGLHRNNYFHLLLFQSQDKNVKLTNWMVAVNNAAYTLCMEDGDWVFNRAKLRELAEDKARQGYSF